MMRNNRKRMKNGFLFFVLILVSGVINLDCAGSSNNEIEKINSIDYLDKIEDLGVPSSAPRYQSIQSEVEEVRLGNTVARAVTFPPQMAILVRLPRLPEKSTFSCQVGVQAPGKLSPEARFEISRRSSQGVDTPLGSPVWIENKAEEAWHPMEVDLSEFSGQEIRLVIESNIAIAGAAPYLANPRLIVPENEKPKQVILMCIDTLRADYLGCYGSTLGLTPSLDLLASEGVRFDACESACPWTLPSVAATITGMYPGMIAADSISEHLRPEETTIAELFSDKGYRTAAITNNHYVSAEVGFFQGYETQRESPKAPADEQVDASLEWIENHLDEDFFLYIHLFDPHVPYDPPEPYLSRHKSGSGRFETEFSQPNEIRSGEIVPTESEKEQIRGLYSGCVAFADAEVGRMMDELKDLGVWDDILFAIYADHGEEFWEHGGFEHGHCMYEEVTRVPLLMKVPGQQPTERKDRVSLVDIVPTFIGYAGLDSPEGLVGADLFADDFDKEMKRRFFIEECIHATESKACVEGDWKQILYFDGVQGPELYDLAEDPFEQNNLVREKAELAETLSAELLVYASQTSEGFHYQFYAPKGDRGGRFRVAASVENGEFKDWSSKVKGINPVKNMSGDRLEVEAKLNRGDHLGLQFMVEPEDADVTFEVENLDDPEMALPWYLGASGEPFEAESFSINMLDRRIAMSYPQARLTLSEGSYIWSVPPSIRAEFEDTLSPETRAELEALGYLNK